MSVLKWNSILLAMGLIVPAAAFGGPLYCGGTVSRIFVDSVGDVIVLSSWRGDFTQVCSLKGSWNSIDTTTCSVWYSMLEVAYHDQKPVTIYYPSADSCATLPTYGSSLAPEYVMLN